MVRGGSGPRSGRAPAARLCVRGLPEAGPVTVLVERGGDALFRQAVECLDVLVWVSTARSAP